MKALQELYLSKLSKKELVEFKILIDKELQNRKLKGVELRKLLVKANGDE